MPLFLQAATTRENVRLIWDTIVKRCAGDNLDGALILFVPANSVLSFADAEHQ